MNSLRRGQIIDVDLEPMVRVRGELSGEDLARVDGAIKQVFGFS